MEYEWSWMGVWSVELKPGISWLDGQSSVSSVFFLLGMMLSWFCNMSSIVSRMVCPVCGIWVNIYVVLAVRCLVIWL
ncbi:hypothetical protein QBC43DRAFT_327811 [Cladorrhinum sp. PSN259]|nr:hypothetical protein QBC43DRAFT_327811 [Cladorrhinum sp. PSN259]